MKLLTTWSCGLTSEQNAGKNENAIEQFGYLCRMKWLRNFYSQYKPYVFSDGWYYIFIVVFIVLLFVFFS